MFGQLNCYNSREFSLTPDSMMSAFLRQANTDIHFFDAPIITTIQSS